MILTMKISETTAMSLQNLRPTDVCVDDVNGVMIGKAGIATDLPRGSQMKSALKVASPLVITPVK